LLFPGCDGDRFVEEKDMDDGFLITNKKQRKEDGKGTIRRGSKE
jgi:hypothetical protein